MSEDFLSGDQFGWDCSSDTKDLIEVLTDEDQEILCVNAHCFQLQGPTSGQTKVDFGCAEYLVDNFGHPRCQQGKQKHNEKVVEILTHSFRQLLGSTICLCSSHYIGGKAEHCHCHFEAARSLHAP